VIQLTPPGALLGLATLPLALKNIRTFSQTDPGPHLNPLLAATVRFQVLLALSSAIGLFLPLG
jgi:1,4-dihydroxy-2-naphthoate octaprenyltransferase